MTIWIERDLCNGCTLCLKGCPYNAVEMKEGKASILDRCTSCGACLTLCKQKAIQTDIQPRIGPDFSDQKGVWVFAEQRNGHLHPVSLELLGKARELSAILQEEVSALLLGHQVTHLCDILTRYGADKVYLVDDPILKYYRTNAYTHSIAGLVKHYKPNILLMGATPVGRDLAPRVSRRIGVGLTADCTELSIDPEEKILLQTRPAFGGNVMATIANRYSRPQMATVRPGVMEAAIKSGTKGQVISCPGVPEENEIGTRLLERVKEDKKRVNLSEAKVIVAGGRGVGDANGFRVLEELAGLLGGGIAGARGTVGEGWIPYDRQVGQTGQSVRPELYIACGLSGAIQHRAGMMNSRYIIAVNKDPRAPIFQVADWGIIGNVHEVIPQMIEMLKQQKI